MPRYDEFRPQDSPNIYADAVVLLRIECHGCGVEFDVEGSGDVLNPIGNPREWHYGDPPAHGCVGDVMNCNDKEVLQVWYKDDRGLWKRVSKLEGLIS